jgi:asparagine N-glycosylation enzyme membrane subunit Stt3
VDKESLGSIYIFIWLWLFIKSIKTVELEERRTLLTPVLSGFFMGLSAWTWGGTHFFILVITTSGILYTLINYRNLEEVFGLTIILMTITGSLTMKIVQAPHFPFNVYFTPNLIFLPLTIISTIYAISIFYHHITSRLGEKNSRYVAASLTILLLGGGIISGYIQNFLNSILGFIRSKILLDKSLIGSTVSENLSPSFFGGGSSFISRVKNGDWFAHFNVILFISVIGFLLLLNQFKNKKDYTSLFVLVFAISGALGMRSDIRLSFALTLPVGILAAYSIFYFINLLKSKEIGLVNTLTNSKKHKVRYKAETDLSNTKMILLLVLVILFGIMASPTVTSYSMLNGRSVDVPTPWYNAMIWLRDNTPPESVIVSWWDYGYWEEAIAKRRAIGDGGNAGPLVYDTIHTEGLEYRGSTEHRDVDLAKMFTSPEDEALIYLRPYVDYEKVPTYILVSYEEFGKSGAINHISRGGNLFIFPQTFSKSGDDAKDLEEIEKFITTNQIESFSPIINLGSYWQTWVTGFIPDIGPDPDMKNKLLPKLLPMNTGFGQGLNHFQKVYPENEEYLPYVLIYRVV